jgi:phosphoadenosine phosphosulfate reductase
MVLLDLVARHGYEIPVYYLDTDLLFPQTHALVARVRARYGIEPRAVKTQLTLPAQAARFGDRLWERDPDRCCALRKVEPQRAFLAGQGAWITGIRRDQSDRREAISFVDIDRAVPGVVKISPLADWSEADVWQYVTERDVPYNELHDRGFPSIGCEPCTRGVAPGGRARDGRWPGFAKTECGLHAPAAEVNS